MYPWRRRPAARPAEPERPQAVHTMLIEAEGFHGREWAGTGTGAMLPPPDPQPPAPQPPRIPPPDWSLAGEVAIDEAELKREPESLPRPQLPPPDWTEG